MPWLRYGPRAKPTPYREGQNAIKNSVTGALIYLPPEAKDVPALMAALVQWADEAEEIKAARLRSSPAWSTTSS